MRLDAVTAELRPRSDWEAVDLGLAMVRRDFWRCFSVWWLAMLPLLVVSGVLLWESPGLWLFVCWWLKPVGSRLVLFEVSRRLFGEKPSWRSSLKEIPKAWVRRFFYRFVLARLSPWLPVALAVEDLEGLRGKAFKQRCRQVSRRGEGVIMWIYLVADLAACWFGLAMVFVVMMFIPDGQEGIWQRAVESWDPNVPMEIPAVILRTVVVCVVMAMSLVDLFVTGAGFGIYLNNRTWIEGWDVELAFKRMARRLTNAAWIAALGLFLWSPPVTAQEEPEDPSVVIQEVKKAPEFKIHTVTDKIPKPRKPPSWEWPDWLKFNFSLGGNRELVGRLVIVCAIGLLLGVIIWLIWINRHVFLIGGRVGTDEDERSVARVVMGMDVSPETLPRDIPSSALALWRQGRHREAMGLLYRGAISRVIENSRVEIEESDTEGDCLRRVDLAGPAAHPDYFRGITGVWMRLAYGGKAPADVEVESLCQKWPFEERRPT